MPAEVSERLVGSPAFKAGGASDPRTEGSIPVHHRQHRPSQRLARVRSMTKNRALLLVVLVVLLAVLARKIRDV